VLHVPEGKTVKLYLAAKIVKQKVIVMLEMLCDGKRICYHSRRSGNE
jgi:hypothetical protein